MPSSWYSSTSRYLFLLTPYNTQSHQKMLQKFTHKAWCEVIENKTTLIGSNYPKISGVGLWGSEICIEVCECLLSDSQQTNNNNNDEGDWDEVISLSMCDVWLISSLCCSLKVLIKFLFGTYKVVSKRYIYTCISNKRNKTKNNNKDDNKKERNIFNKNVNLSRKNATASKPFDSAVKILLD